MAIRTDVLGRNIRYYRKVAGLTQAELSKRISITTKFLSRLELGERTPSLDVLYLISKELHVSMDALVDEQPRDWPPDSELVYMKLFADCTEREYAILVSLVQYVKVLLRRSAQS